MPERSGENRVLLLDKRLAESGPELCRARSRAGTPVRVGCSELICGKTSVNAPSGPHAGRAGHDLNYMAEAALLGVVTDAEGAPSLPVTVLADIAAGTYPAVVNILLALRQAEKTGEGAAPFSKSCSLRWLSSCWMYSVLGPAQSVMWSKSMSRCRGPRKIWLRR
ncbi:CoA transferase [Nocardia sp. CA2R105]|uniref:CoA transferase n=1 Tax=Nocardia coffeae TaxID=2873381 RepID=UPI001CA6B253|nr:CoA transferase [Nocardia coffeae]MBY8857128.1 CoA transferase [Nocardia coffeae]